MIRTARFKEIARAREQHELAADVCRLALNVDAPPISQQTAQCRPMSPTHQSHTVWRQIQFGRESATHSYTRAKSIAIPQRSKSRAQTNQQTTRPENRIYSNIRLQIHMIRAYMQCQAPRRR